MRIVIIEFMSLDGVVQAPGSPDEDTDGDFAHGGWTHPFFDAEVVGGAYDDAMTGTEALLFGRRTWQGMAAAMPVLLGGGKRIFPDDGALRTLELASTTVSPTGTQVCAYRPAAA